jgi:methylglyoxal synthase
MANKTALMEQKKKIALIAHDHNKSDLMEWVKFNKGTLLKHELYATGTTGKVLEKELGMKNHHFRERPARRRPANRLPHR